MPSNGDSVVGIPIEIIATEEYSTYPGFTISVGGGQLYFCGVGGNWISIFIGCNCGSGQIKPFLKILIGIVCIF
mgnify:CR=1 FL=1